jgi:hypothetical protein
VAGTGKKTHAYRFLEEKLAGGRHLGRTGLILEDNTKMRGL